MRREPVCRSSARAVSTRSEPHGEAVLLSRGCPVTDLDTGSRTTLAPGHVLYVTETGADGVIVQTSDGSSFLVDPSDAETLDLASSMARDADPLPPWQVPSYLDCVEVTIGFISRVRHEDRAQLIAVCERLLASVRDASGARIPDHLKRRTALLADELAEVSV